MSAFCLGGNLGTLNATNSAFGVGANQSACTKFDATKISCDNNCGADKPFFSEDFKDGLTCSATRLAIIAETSGLTIDIAYIGIAVVSGVCVLFFDIFDKDIAFA